MPYVESDTRKAFDLIGGDGAILWHGYGMPAIERARSARVDAAIYVELTEFVDGLSATREIWWIEETTLAL